MKKLKPLGGQAIIEGVLIKAPNNVSMAVRGLNGKIKVKRDKHISLTEKNAFFRLPLVRGVINLWDMLSVGVSALTWSANQQGEEEELGFWELVITFGAAILITIGLFILLPYYASKFFYAPDTWMFGLVDGIFRLLVFLAYLIGIGFMSDVKTLFKYHGAEHMAVHCYENRKALNVKNVRKYPPEHPRCGTSWLFYVVVVSIVLFSLVRTPHWYYNISARVVLVPVVAGISYELLKLSVKYKWLNWMSYPGIWTQKLTTSKPTNKQIEVAIAAVKKAQK